jgi:hypothetical protein
VAGAVGAAPKSKDDTFAGVAIDAIGTFGVRRVGGKLANMVPEQMIESLRRVPLSGAIAPTVSVALALGLKAVGLPASIRFLTVDAVTDFLVSIQERVTGAPVTEVGRKTLASKAEEMRAKLEAARNTQVCVVQCSTEFHHSSCVLLPHPKDRTARVFKMTVEEADGQGLEPAPCCSALTTKQIQTILDLEKEQTEMAEPKRPKTASELLATPAGKIILDYVKEFYDADKQDKVYRFLVKHLDEGEVGLLSQAGLTKEEFKARLKIIKNHRKAGSVGAAFKEGKKGAKKLRKMLGFGKPLDDAADWLDEIKDDIDNL